MDWFVTEDLTAVTNVIIMSIAEILIIIKISGIPTQYYGKNVLQMILQQNQI